MKLKSSFGIILLLLLFSLYSNAQSPNWVWASSGGGIYDEVVNGIAIDANGNSYVTGYFESPSITLGSITISNPNINGNIFIAKYDALGNAMWVKGGSGNNFSAMATDIAADANGNSYITGNFSDTLILDGNVLISTDGDIFIAKYDTWGNLLWVKTEGGTGSDVGKSIALDANGNLFITGSFMSPVLTLDTFNLLSSNSNIFSVKLDTAGNIIWATGIGNSSTCYMGGVAVDAIGNSYITGAFDGASVTFGNTTLINSSGQADFFIVKCNSSGNVIWAKGAIGTALEGGIDVAAHSAGNSYITGRFHGSTITFDTITLTNAGGVLAPDIFTVSYDSAGNVLWAKSARGYYNTEYVYGITVDLTGNSYITGSFSSDTLFFGNIPIKNVNLGGYDVFIAKYDASGNEVWAKGKGGSNDEEGMGIAVDANQKIFLAGYFNSPTLNFGSTTLTNTSGNTDILLAKLNSINTGIENLYNENGTYLSPNPALNNFTITLPRIAQKVNVAISDITGKIIYNNSEVTTQKLEVNTKEFSDGIYFVQIQTPGFIETKKLIIQK